jgi:hypothetical protein
MEEIFEQFIVNNYFAILAVSSMMGFFGKLGINTIPRSAHIREVLMIF